MSVVRISPAPGQSGTFGLITDSDVERRWFVQVSSKTADDAVSIRNYGQSTTAPDGQKYFPTPFVTLHPSLPSLVCKSLELTQRTDGPLVWDAVAKYSSRPVSELDIQVTEAGDPILRPASIQWTANGYQKALEQDKDGKAIVNSAGDPFNPPVEVEQYRWVASVTKNFLQVPGWILQYAGAVNSDTFVIDGQSVPPKTARVTGLAISEYKREKIATGVEFLYRTVGLRIEFRFEGFQLKVLDRGLRRIDPNDSTKRIPIYEDGTVDTPIRTPRLLDGAGGTLTNPTSARGTFVIFNVHRELPFNGVLPLS